MSPSVGTAIPIFRVPATSYAILTGLILSMTTGALRSQTFTAGAMWGVSISGGYGSNTGTDNSASSHLAESAIANHVEAAKAGVILNPNLSTSLTIQSVGSQTIVSNTVTGNNNTKSISGTQSSSNSGTVTNQALSQY